MAILRRSVVRLAGQVSLDGKGAKMPHIVWDEGGPRTCLLVKKPNSGAASRALKEIALWCGHVATPAAQYQRGCMEASPRK